MRVDKIWKEYVKSKSVESRNTLIQRYIPLVSFIASKISSTLPPHIEFKELESVGILGLMNALERFDSTRGIEFKTFAKIRIYGSIMDWLRALDWIPRSVRQKNKEVEEAYHILEQRLGRTATDQEMADELRLSINDFEKILTDISGVTLLSLEQIYDNESGQGSAKLMDFVECHNSENPLEQMEDEEMKEDIAQLINKLPEKEKLVIALYYYEDLTLKEIGKILDLSESRISQIHTRAILKLRSKFRTSLNEVNVNS